MRFESAQVWIMRIDHSTVFRFGELGVAIHIERVEVPLGIFEHDALEKSVVDTQRLGTRDHNAPGRFAARFEARIDLLSIGEFWAFVNFLGSLDLRTSEAPGIVLLAGTADRFRIETAASGIFNE